MIYLKSFRFLSRKDEEAFLYNDRHGNVYLNKYPFNVFRYRELPVMEFDPITIFYGTNGSGKSTLLNVIAEKLHIQRNAIFNTTDFFQEYVSRCSFTASSSFREDNLLRSRILTSDDVFDYLLNIRSLNAQVDRNRDELFDEYARLYAEVRDGSKFRMRSLDDYETLKKHVEVSKKHASGAAYFRRYGIQNVAGNSNGESAIRMFMEQMQPNALYLLDEPENSLSAEKQIELQNFIFESARFYNCQFIVATHSPFFLSTRGAKIYDLDETPPEIRRWTELPNMKAYHELFFKNHGAFVQDEEND